MTPQQIQSAARLLCEKRGIDPDGVTSVTGKGEPSPMLEWQLISIEIKTHYDVLTSISDALGMDNREEK